MRYLTAAIVVLLLACGGGEGPTDIQPPTPSLAIVAGDSQEVQVTDTLPFDAEVQVLRDGNPVPDQLVDWRVLEDDAGEPFVSTTRTDDSGVTKNRVVAGTRAHTHPEMDGNAHMEVRWIEQETGEAIVDTTITYRVLPAEPLQTRWEATGTDTLTLSELNVRDQYRNPVHGWRVLADTLIRTLGSEYGSEDARTVYVVREEVGPTPAPESGVFPPAGEGVACLEHRDSGLFSVLTVKIQWVPLVEGEKGTNAQIRLEDGTDDGLTLADCP